MTLLLVFLMNILIIFLISGIVTGIIFAIFWKYSDGGKKDIIKFPRYIDLLMYVLIIFAGPGLLVVFLFDKLKSLIEWLKEDVTV